MSGAVAAAAAAGAAEASGVPLSPAFYVAIALYGVASLLYFGLFVTERGWVLRAGKWVMFAAFLAHGVDIALRDLQAVSAGTSVREALGALAWAVVGAYLLAGIWHRLGVAGVLVAPLALFVLAAARLTPDGGAVDDLTALGKVHISLATLGVAIFALATALAIIYLIEERSLKRKRFDTVLYRRGIALETLDTLSHRLILVGFPIFTLALALGVAWVSQRGTGFDRPEYSLSLVTWLSFGGLLLARGRHGWRGRKAALLTLCGFIAAVLVLAIYLARRSLG